MSTVEIRKSFSSVFKKRLTSPLYGSFMLSWAIWNWKILYLTIFVSQDLIKPFTKIEYILNNYANWYYLLVFPLLSTVFLITVVPWLANEAYRISLKHENKTKLIKDKADAKKSFTTGERAEFQRQLLEKEEEYKVFVGTVYKQIKAFEEQIKSLTDQNAVLINQLQVAKEKENNEIERNKELIEKMRQFAWTEVTKGKSEKDIAIKLIDKFNVHENSANDLAEEAVMKYGPDIYGKY